MTGASIYVVMITVTLAHLEAVSGQVPFDMRPFGYGPQDAATLLEGLGTDGRSYYLRHQIPLDTVYPALLALTLMSLMLWFAQALPAHRLVRIGIVLSGSIALFDYSENLAIVSMILSWPDLSVPVVHASSIATVAKSVSTTAGVIVAFLIGIVWAKQTRATSQ